MLRRFLEWLCFEPGEKIVLVKSWRPTRGPHGIEWPTVLLDRPPIGARRETASPVWDRVRLAQLFRR